MIAGKIKSEVDSVKSGSLGHINKSNDTGHLLTDFYSKLSKTDRESEGDGTDNRPSRLQECAPKDYRITLSNGNCELPVIIKV